MAVDRRYSLLKHTHEDEDWTVTGDWTFRDSIRIEDTGGTDSALISHDGADLRFDFTNTADVEFAGLTGEVDFNSSPVVVRRGINGSYNRDTGSGGNWAGTIWSIGESWNGGNDSGSGWTDTSLYGVAWIRESHAEADATIGEGLYVYRNGILASGLGRLGSKFYTDVHIDGSADLFFGSTVRQMLNLHGTTYAIGVESFTQYFRTNTTFRWYTGAADGGTSDIMELVDGRLTVDDGLLDFGGDIQLTMGQNATTAMAVRANSNPSNSEAIFAVESSGSATRFFVTQGAGAIARDGFYIGTADSGDTTGATLVEVLHHVSSGYVGGKITVSSTAPSSPAQGDVWFDTS